MQPRSTIRADTSDRHLRKYTNQNPFHRLALRRFFDRMAEELRRLGPRSLLEFGCGEGLLLAELKRRGVIPASVLGIDLRDDALAMASELHPEWSFVQADLLGWNPPGGSFDVVVASQVLEHLPEPGPILDRLVALSSGHLILTVPWEPWFRLINLFRLRDVRRLGNHPEHVNLWTGRGFRQFVSGHAEIVRAVGVFPFTVVVARPGARVGGSAF